MLLFSAFLGKYIAKMSIFEKWEKRLLEIFDVLQISAY